MGNVLMIRDFCVFHCKHHRLIGRLGPGARISALLSQWSSRTTRRVLDSLLPGPFSYLGLEIIGITAEETERQRETLPHAVRRVAHRSVYYHVGAILVLGLNVSANDPILKSIATQDYQSPFFLMVQRAGIPALGTLINVVIVIALISVANTRLYVSVHTHFENFN